MPRLCRAMARVRAVDLRGHRKNNAKRVKVFGALLPCGERPALTESGDETRRAIGCFPDVQH